jgi:uncharacterized membrane protein YfcA
MFRSMLDKLSISFSVVCAIHCLALPILLVFGPTLTSIFFTYEHFHLALLFLILPASIFALFIGCKQHRNNAVAITGAIGLLIISLTAILSGYYHHELLEKVMTLVGATLIAISHYFNQKLCRPTTCHSEHSH